MHFFARFYRQHPLTTPVFSLLFILKLERITEKTYVRFLLGDF